LFHKNSEEIVSGYFGKLPEFNDFIKFNAGSSEILYIDNWLQEGIAQAKTKFKAEWKVNYDSLPPTGFFLPVPSSGKITVGMLYAGKDKSGREFPFIIFSIVAGNQFEPYYLMPAEIESILSGLDEVLRKEENLNSLNTALKNFNMSLPPKDLVRNNFRQYLSVSRINEFITRTHLSSLEEIMRDRMYQDNSFVKITFVADEAHFSYDAGFLIYLLHKKLNLSYRHSSLFWNMDPSGSYQIIIFPFKLTAFNFIDILSIDCKDDRMIHIKSSPGDYEYPGEINLTLADFIKTL
jgi:type VI secretion system ImpM family protein